MLGQRSTLDDLPERAACISCKRYCAGMEVVVLTLGCTRLHCPDTYKAEEGA
jgi:hypothetical protein